MKETGKSANGQQTAYLVPLGEFAQQVIAEQFKRIVKQEKAVLADREPEHLHQMRVGTRRLRTAHQVFASAVEVPKAAKPDKLRDLARVLGAVRDLDVQTASLQQEYRPNLDAKEQKKLDKAIATLTKQRAEALSRMQAVLTDAPYQQMKAAYEKWLKRPKFKAIARLPLNLLLPDILSPLLAELLLHPGWLMAIDQVSTENSEVLHDLRKVCKHVRYQTEFFAPFYGDEFNDWINQVKKLQDDLGSFQDTQVLQQLLAEEFGRKAKFPELQTLIEQKQHQALSGWEEIRHQYLDEDFRYYLHQILLQPRDRSNPTQPELIAASAADSN